MKKELLLAIIALVAIITPKAAYAQLNEEVAGTYTGILKVSQDEIIMGEPSTENVYLTATNDGTTTLEIRNFAFKLGTSAIQLGDIVIPGVELQEREDAVVLLPKDVTLTLVQPIGDVEVHLKESTIINEKMVLSLSVETIYPVELLIDVDFEGTKTQTGINDVVTGKRTVYYNPGTESLIISGAENQSYEIYTVTGVRTMSGIITSGRLNVSNLSKGIYLIKAGNHTTKFVKQ